MSAKVADAQQHFKSVKSVVTQDSSCCPHIIFSSGDMTTMTTITTIDVQETTTALLLGLTTCFSLYNYLRSISISIIYLVSWKGVW